MINSDKNNYLKQDCKSFIMDCFTGARSAAAFEYSNSIPHPSSLTYEGLFSENYFKLNALTDKNKDIEISQAQLKNPIDGKLDYWLGILVKSKYDGIGIREPVDLSITVDISGSMGSYVGESKMTRLELAKIACLKLMKLLNKDDHLSFSTFNNEPQRIFPLTQGDQLNQKHIDQINAVKLGGGTTLYNALLDTYNIIKTSNNRNKRIIFITDLEDNCNQPLLIDLFKKSAEEGIYITVIGISYSCNTSLAEIVTHTKGCNYFIAGQEKDLDKYLVNQFNYIIFPSNFDVSLDFKSSNLKVIKSIGAGFNIPEEHQEKDKEWRTKNHKLATESFKNKINLLLLYFNRIKKRLPMPVLAKCCNYLRYDKKTVCKVDTSFPSDLMKKNNEIYMEGGMILLKMTKEDTINNYYAEIDLKFSNLDGTKHVQTYHIDFPNFKTHDEYFSDTNIKNSLTWYYYVKFCRQMMRAEHGITKKVDKILFKTQFRDSYEKISASIKQFFDTQCQEYVNTKKTSHLKKIDDLIKLVKENQENDLKQKHNQNEPKLDLD